MDPHGRYQSQNEWEQEKRMIQKEKHILYEKILITSAILSIITFAGFIIYMLSGGGTTGTWFGLSWLGTTILIRILLSIWMKDFDKDVKHLLE
jgi:hypothetical protein